MSAIDAWKETERAMASQDLTLHNLGNDIWEVADQMQAAIVELEAELAIFKAEARKQWERAESWARRRDDEPT